MDMKEPKGWMVNVMRNVRAFLDAAQIGDRHYTPEYLADILFYSSVTVAEALYRMGLLDRRGFERRAKPDMQFSEQVERRFKERRFSY